MTMSPGCRVGTRICSEEARPVDGAVEDPGRGQAGDPQCREKRTGLPPGDGAWSWTRAPRRARPYRRRRLFCRFRREKPGVSAGRRGGVPHAPRGRRQVDRVRRAGPFFLTRPEATARQIVARLAGVPSASFSSAKVRSGCSAISAARVCRWGSSIRRRPGGRAARLVSRRAVNSRRSRGTSPRPRLHPGITVEQGPRPSNRYRSSCIGACRSDEPKRTRGQRFRTKDKNMKRKRAGLLPSAISLATLHGVTVPAQRERAPRVRPITAGGKGLVPVAGY